MMKNQGCWAMFLMVFVLMGCSTAPVTVDSLLSEMVNRDAITYMPDYKVKQVSSYDRSMTGVKDSTWFANWDRSMFVRVEEQPDSINEYVMMDEKGPGAIVRFWMTFAGPDCGQGILKIYIDDNDIPAVEGKALDILSGGRLTGMPLSTSVSEKTSYEMRGHNLYLPIPYAKSCKVTYKTKNISSEGAKNAKDECVYYNINYRSYPKGTKVESFSFDNLNFLQAKLDSINQILGKLVPDYSHKSLAKYDMPKRIAAGDSEMLEISGGNSAIRQLLFKMPYNDCSALQRKLVLEIAFDDQTTVWVPLGDFVGTGYKHCEVNNWYSSVSQDGALNSYWIMPFKKKCKVSIHNFSDKEVVFEDSYALVGPYSWTDKSMYFGAAWHQYTNLETGMMKNNEGGGDPFDINYVSLTGEGIYAGDGITLFNTVYAWWGEGDEKIFVDGESFPSHVGTGTEDYYGYAWCRPEVFINHPYISQPSGDGNFVPGYTVNSRYRSLDVIPFKESIQVDMEMWHWTKATINIAPVTYWYIRPGGSFNIQPDVQGVQEKLIFKRSDLISNVVVDNFIEGENLDLVSCSGGNYRFEDSYKYGWSNNMQMLWRNVECGHSLELEFIATNASYDSMDIIFTGDPNGGVFAVLLNGKKLKEIDVTCSKRGTFVEHLPNVFLKEGKNVLSFVCLKSPKGKTRLGVDKVEFD